jgi:histidine triad (HIT) family protein
MSSIFTRIINREIPADIFYEDENFIAFLDINPVRDGHTLVVPKFKEEEKEEDYIFNLSEEKYLELMLTAKKVAKILEEKLKDKLNFEKIFIGIEGLEVSHVHVHLIPLTDNKGFNFAKEVKFSIEEIKKLLV